MYKIICHRKKLCYSIDDSSNYCFFLALLDIPVYNNRVQSLHVLFSLYMEFKNSQVCVNTHTYVCTRYVYLSDTRWMYMYFYSISILFLKKVKRLLKHKHYRYSTCIVNLIHTFNFSYCNFDILQLYHNAFGKHRQSYKVYSKNGHAL